MKREALGEASVTSKAKDGTETVTIPTRQFVTQVAPENAPGSPTVKAKFGKTEKTVAAVNVPQAAVSFPQFESFSEAQSEVGQTFESLVLDLTNEALRKRGLADLTGEFRKMTILPSDVAEFVRQRCNAWTVASLLEEKARGGGKKSAANQALADIQALVSQAGDGGSVSVDQLRAMLASRGITL